MSNDLHKNNGLLSKSDEIATLPLFVSSDENEVEEDSSEDDSRSSTLYSSSAHSESDDVSPDPVVSRSRSPF